MNKLVPLLLLLVVLTAGCVPGGPITISTSGEPPTINSFDASPPTIAAGESSTLIWGVAGATTVSMDQGVGNVALGGTRAVMPSATTVYTLTATSASGMSTMATAQVIVTGVSTPTPTPTPTPTGLPVVNYFIANPPIISAGGSTTLGWNVSNATSVTIDPGAGSVVSVGTTLVSPATSTHYTLTAVNAPGLYYVTIPVLVSGAPPPAGEPDLIIEDISKAGDKISYKIKNQGGVAAGPSTSTLVVDTVVVANEAVGLPAPGEAKTETCG